MSEITDYVNSAQEFIDSTDISRQYSHRHGLSSAAVLTVTDDTMASKIVNHLAPRIEGKTVVEIGGGIGLLSLHMGRIAKRVYCIEANPVWSSAFVMYLLKDKPKNVSYLFGVAEEFVGLIKADVSVFCTHSGVESMRGAASLFSSEVIDIWGDFIRLNPDQFVSVEAEIGKSPMGKHLRSRLP